MFQLSNILLSALGSAVLVFIVPFFGWKWSKIHFRFAVTALSTFLGYTAWNLLQNATGADSVLNIDWQILPVSWSDVGSGVVAFLATVIVIGLLTYSDDKAWRVITGAGF